jgi:hypothetical protein
MQDPRLSERVPSILEAHIQLAQGSPKLPGTIRDLSLTGACLWLPGSASLPPEFALEIPYLQQTVRARLVWTRGQTHGVAFLDKLHSPDGADPLASLRRKQLPGSLPAATPKGLAPLVQDVLAEAHQQIAEILGVPMGRVRIKLEVDP